MILTDWIVRKLSNGTYELSTPASHLLPIQLFTEFPTEEQILTALAMHKRKVSNGQAIAK